MPHEPTTKQLLALIRGQLEHVDRRLVAVQRTAYTIEHRQGTMFGILHWIARHVRPRDTVAAHWTRLRFNYAGITLDLETQVMNIELQPGQTVTATATFTHPRTGRPAPVENVTFSSDNESIATVAADPRDDTSPANVFTATITTTADPAAVGSAVIHCLSDTIVGDGENLLDLVGTVVIPEDNVTVGELAFGTPSAPTA